MCNAVVVVAVIAAISAQACTSATECADATCLVTSVSATEGTVVPTEAYRTNECDIVAAEYCYDSVYTYPYAGDEPWRMERCLQQTYAWCMGE